MPPLSRDADSSRRAERLRFLTPGLNPGRVPGTGVHPASYPRIQLGWRNGDLHCRDVCVGRQGDNDNSSANDIDKALRPSRCDAAYETVQSS